MSVTFYAAEYAFEEFLGGVALCPIDEVEDGHSVNLANLNAARVLEALGFPSHGADSFCGESQAEDFLGRALVALAVSPQDEAIPAYLMRSDEMTEAVRALVGDGDAQVWHGPQRAGYLQDKLTVLVALGEFCRTHGYIVAWS